MTSVVVCGSGIVGLLAALLLAGDGHEVTVLEADPRRQPADPKQTWESWQRPGVAQFRQPHNLLPPFLAVLDEQLPDLTGRLLAAGCGRGNLLEPHPPSIPEWVPRPDDTRFDVITGRRAVVEAVVTAAWCLARLPDVLARPGVRERVDALGARTGSAGRPPPGPDRRQVLELLNPSRARPGSAG